MVPYGVKTIWFQMRDPHKQSIPAAWIPQENHTASRHMVSGGATAAAPKRLGVWDHKVAQPSWRFAECSAAGPADRIKKEPYGRAPAGGSVISWAAPTIRGGTIWWGYHMVGVPYGRSAIWQAYHMVWVPYVPCALGSWHRMVLPPSGIASCGERAS